MDVWFARQMVSERLKLAENDIPPGYGSPELGPVSTGLGEIYEFYLASKKHTPMELRTMLDWVVAIKLRAVPGVVEVNGMGGRGQAVPGRPRPQAAGRATGCRSATSRASSRRTTPPIGAGYIEKNRESFVIRADAQFHSIEEIENTVVTSDADGTPVLHQAARRGAHRAGAALRRGHQARRGRDRRGHGDDADRLQLARGRARGEGAAGGDPEGAARRASRSGRTTTAPSSSAAC